jgi:hypothetical protein
MSTLTALARARAVARGRAQPACTVRHVHVSARPLVLIPLALAGEANAPLAVMVGEEPGSPRLLVVAQPRNRDQRFSFAATLAGVLVRYIGGFCSGAETVLAGPGREPRLRYPDAPQLLVPNRAGIGFVRLLGRSTRFRRPDGEYPVDPAVPVLGRWLTFLAQRAEVPGSCLLLAATEALALHWASGQSAVEDRNLAALLGWIDPPPGMTGAEAAAAAEDPLTWPPAGPATDPTFDNEVLAPLIAACARSDADPGARQRAEAALRGALAGQLTPTWRLMWRAVGLLRGLPPGGHVARRWDLDRDAFTGYAEHLRQGGPPQPRRDSAVAAARQLDWLERTQAGYAAQRALDDPLVMAEYRLTGEAFAGTVTAAEPGRIDASGKRRKLRPLVTVTTGDPVRIQPAAELVSPSRPSQHATVVSVSAAATQTPSASAAASWPAAAAVPPSAPPATATAVVLELSGGMGRALTPEPGSVPEVGGRVCYTAVTDSYQAAGSFPPREQTPWTHGGPPPEYVPADSDAREAWS